ncbi:conserved hypothetical protein [Ricinus communis]|uniref:Uncharacterized protein n=1 Tax=Ricinus communis TaxID=3988 RepID=B9S3L2_RICCO|nr:conserved hypothetical protein [Ricinus communis]
MLLRAKLLIQNLRVREKRNLKEKIFRNEGKFLWRSQRIVNLSVIDTNIDGLGSSGCIRDPRVEVGKNVDEVLEGIGVDKKTLKMM